MSESKRVIEGSFELSQAQVPRVYHNVTGERQRWDYTPLSTLVKDELRAMGVKDGDHIRITVEKIDPPKSALDEAEEALKEAMCRLVLSPESRWLIDAIAAIIRHLKEAR